MRLVTITSIATLAVAVAALVLVLGLYAELEKSEPETPKEHTQELNETMVNELIKYHVQELIKLAGITHVNKKETHDL